MSPTFTNGPIKGPWAQALIRSNVYVNNIISILNDMPTCIYIYYILLSIFCILEYILELVSVHIGLYKYIPHFLALCCHLRHQKVSKLPKISPKH